MDMDSFDRILKKLKTVIAKGEKRIVNDKEVAKALGLTPQNFSNLKQRDSIPTEYIMNFCAKNKISINWMFYDQLYGIQDLEATEYIGINYYDDIDGACGGGAFNNDYSEISKINLPKYILNYFNYTDDNSIHIVNATGDSMEPSISSGDKILIDTRYKQLNEKDIFIITTNNGTYIKRIKVLNNTVILRSDNNSYTDIIIDLLYENVNVIGKVIGSL